MHLRAFALAVVATALSSSVVADDQPSKNVPAKTIAGIKEEITKLGFFVSQEDQLKAQHEKRNLRQAASPMVFKYIVLLKPNVAPADVPGLTDYHSRFTLAENEAPPVVEKELFVSQRAQRGEMVVVRMTTIQADNVRSHEDLVVSVTKDDYVYAFGRRNVDAGRWGIDRVDSPVGLDRKYNFDFTGNGVSMFVLDTGVKDHNDFGNRLKSDKGFHNAADWEGNLLDGETTDCNGHGTHVASTAAGSAYGIASGAEIIPLRALNCYGSGSYDQILEAMEFVLTFPNRNRRSVINMSIGGGADALINDAVERLVEDGVVAVVAAGNDNIDACRASPAGAESAITVGALDDRDQTADEFTNWGSCVDVYAPGVDITAAGISGSQSTATLTGTSMASPIVAGIAAQIWEQHPQFTAQQVIDQIKTIALEGRVVGVKAVDNAVNRLAQSPRNNQVPLGPDQVAPNLFVDGRHYESYSMAEFGASLFDFPDGIFGTLVRTKPTNACVPLKNAVKFVGGDKIALIQRGGCDFATKVLNAEAAGAIAVIVYNNYGNTHSRMRYNPGMTLPTIPSIMVGSNDGWYMKKKQNKPVHIVTPHAAERMENAPAPSDGVCKPFKRKKFGNATPEDVTCQYPFDDGSGNMVTQGYATTSFPSYGKKGGKVFSWYFGKGILGWCMVDDTRWMAVDSC